MRAGGLRYKLVLLRPEAVQNGYGEESLTWREQALAWAERAKLSGARSEEVGEHFADYRAEFNIRWAHTVAEGWRVQLLGGQLYTVTNIIPNIERGMKTLVCERVNE